MTDISRPTLLLNEAICKANIKRIVAKAARAGVTLRPHFKTHQSHEVGRWFREEGVKACTVSSVKMASYFAEDGWDDITVAFPLNHREASEINRLASSVKLNLIAVSVEGIDLLGKKLTSPVGVFIEIDPGYHRTGVAPDDYTSIDNMLAMITANTMFSFKGFLGHAGQSYGARSKEAILEIHSASTAAMKQLGDKYRPAYPDLVLSVGDTPTCSVADDFTGVDEIRPGNLVFYDVTQSIIGSCTRQQIAIAMVCPVVAVNAERNEIFVHGGGVHFSKDFYKRDDGRLSFGEVVKLTDNGWTVDSTTMFMKSLSQEHGVVAASPEDIKNVQIGDLIGVLPVHACLTADAMGEYVTKSGVIRMMEK